MHRAPPPRSFPGPLAAAAMIGVAAQALFLWRLATPHKLMFDEVHYVPAARTLLTLSGPTNIEHPLLGKEFIALGIRLFGDDSFGWRFFATLAGTGIVLGVFAILWLLFGRVRTAAMGASFALLNFTLFIQARIAMLDGYMAVFVIAGIAALLWAMRAEARWVWPRWLLGAALLGLATGAKWNAAPYVGYAGVALIAVRLHDARRLRQSVYTALNGRDQPHWPGLPVVPALLALGIVAFGAYVLTFWPAFHYASDPLTFPQILPFQARMYAEQTQVLAPHPYQSSWWSWPLIIRPIWYLYEPVDGAVRGVLMLGNPAILWGGLVAVGACLYGGWRDRSVKLLAVASLWIASYAIWIVIPKSIGFFYYYYLPSILLCLPLAAAFDRFATGRWRRADFWFLLIAVALFGYFYPIIAALPLADPQAFHHWMWLPRWP